MKQDENVTRKTTRLKQLQLILQNIADGVTVQDINGHLVYVNKAAAKAIGYTSARQMLAQDPHTILEKYQMVDEKKNPFPIDKLPGRLVLKGKKSAEAIIGFQESKNNGYRWALIKSRPIKDSKGNIQYAINIFHDITDRMDAFHRITLREKQQSVLLRVSQKALTAKSLDELFTYTVKTVSKTLDLEFVKILKFDPKENDFLVISGVGWKKNVVGKVRIPADSSTHAGYTISKHKPIVVHDLESEKRFKGHGLLHEHKAVSGISTIIQGRKQPFGILSAHSRNKKEFSEDDTAFFQSIATILSQKITNSETEKALRESEEQYRNLVVLAPDVIYTLSKDGKLTSFNPAFQRITGWSENEWLGKHFGELVHPEDLETAIKMFEKNVSGKYTSSYELRIRAKDGAYLTGEFVSSPRIEGKEITGSIGVARDITKRKKTEQREQYLNKATKVLTRTFDYEKILSKVASLYVPEVGDWCLVNMFDPAGNLQTIDFLHKDPKKQKLLKQLQDMHPFDSNILKTALQNMESGKGELFTDITNEQIKAISKDTKHFKMLKELGITSAMTIPFVARGKILGAITLMCSTSGAQFDRNSFRFAQELGTRIALSLDNSKLVMLEQRAKEQTEQTMVRIHKLQQITSALSEAVTPKQIASVVLKHGLRAIGANAGSFCLLNRKKNSLVIMKIFGYEKTVIKKWKEIPLDTPLPLADAVKQAEIVRISSVEELEDRYPGATKSYLPKNKAFVAAPLLIKDNVVGAIGCSFKEEQDFEIQDQVFLSSVINQCAIALERALLFEAESKAKTEAESEIERRKKVEDDLRQSEESFRSLFELAPDAIYSLSKGGKFTQLNPAFERITGWSRDKWIGKSYKELVYKDDLKEAKKEFISGIGGQSSQPYELRLNTKSGKRIVCEFRSKPRIKDGKIIGKLGIFRDVTLRKQEEKERDYMLGIASHELKTPLATIKAFSQILKKRLTKDNVTEGYVQYVDRIDQHVNRLTKLIGDMLDITRIRAGRVELKEDIFDVDELVSEVVSDIQATIESHTIHIEGKADTYIQADKDRLSRVLLNLLSNAVKYSPKADTVKLVIDSSRTLVKIDVVDYGMGIPKETQERIFEPFTHIVSKTRGKIPSVGLGLYISSQLIKHHGGKIWFDSEVGKGTTFHVELPIKPKVDTKR